ncbi:hypothetical protein [Streptomyces sp. NPDC012888]|uniref:hypothetical protein n=1 Tax=Streptomyces sp. NPDC012888 TaxID=3364855 RepID=UPI0036B53F03
MTRPPRRSGICAARGCVSRPGGGQERLMILALLTLLPLGLVMVLTAVSDSRDPR